MTLLTMQSPFPHPSLSVIVAAFNEADCIVDCVRAVAAHTPADAEILVVDGGNDDSLERLAAIQSEVPNLRPIRNHNDRGKGHAIRTGIAHARAPVHVQFDADLQFFPEHILPLANAVQSGLCDLAMGSRFLPNNPYPVAGGRARTLGNRILSAYASALFFHRMTDVLAGIKAWSKAAAQRIDLQSDDFSYEVELPARALQRGLSVRDFPVGTRHRNAGTSKVGFFRSGSRIVLNTTRFRLSR